MYFWFSWAQIGLVLGGPQGWCCCWPWLRHWAGSGIFSLLVFGVFCLFLLLPPLAVWEHKHGELAAWLSQAAKGGQVSEILVEDVSLCPGEGSVHSSDRLECYWPKCILGPPGSEVTSSLGDQVGGRDGWTTRGLAKLITEPEWSVIWHQLLSLKSPGRPLCYRQEGRGALQACPLSLYLAAAQLRVTASGICRWSCSRGWDLFITPEFLEHLRCRCFSNLWEMYNQEEKAVKKGTEASIHWPRYMPGTVRGALQPFI